MKETIIWFQDGVKLKSSPQKWGEIDMLTNRLITLIGHPDFSHRIIDPIASKDKLKLDVPESPTVCLDLTGTGIGSSIFPEVPQIQNFRLSRVRNVTSPRLDGCGHILSLNPSEIGEIKNRFDMTRPLILDDVVWSGRTALETVNLLDLPLRSSIFSCFAMNTGNFGEGRPGAAELLSSQGIQLSWGESVATPQDDGFHLADFFDHPLVANNEVFDVIIRIQQLRELKDQDLAIKDLLKQHQKALFSNARSTADMQNLQALGKLLVRGGLSKNSFFDVNPLNWLMPSFSKRVRSEMLVAHKTQILDTLKRFQDII